MEAVKPHEISGHGLLLIRSHLNSLKPAERRVAEYILENSMLVVRLSITKLAEEAGVSEATIIKFCQRVGYPGYQELKISLAQEMGEGCSEQGIYGPIQADEDIETVIEKIFQIYNRSLNDTKRLLLKAPISQAVRKVLGAGRIYFFGYGASGIVAQDAEIKFKRINRTAEAFTDNHMQKTIAALLKPDDLVVAISDSGRTKELVEALEIAKPTGACIIAITSNMGSPLSKLADLVLLTSVTETPFRGSALASRMVQLAIIDVLFLGAATADYQNTVEFLNKTRMALLNNKLD